MPQISCVDTFTHKSPSITHTNSIDTTIASGSPNLINRFVYAGLAFAINFVFSPLNTNLFVYGGLAIRYTQRIQAIMALHEHTKEQVREITHSQHSTPLVDALFKHPIFRVKDPCERLNIKKATLHNLIKQLLDADIIVILKEGAGRRPATLAFPQLLNIAEGREVVQTTNK